MAQPAEKRMKRLITVVADEDEILITEELAKELASNKFKGKSMYTEWKDKMWTLELKKTEKSDKYTLKWVETAHQIMKDANGDYWEEVRGSSKDTQER